MKCDARVALNARARRKKFSAKFRGAKKNWRRRLGGAKKNFHSFLMHEMNTGASKEAK